VKSQTEGGRAVPSKYIAAPVDRIDSTIGYVAGNIQWVHNYHGGSCGA